jgi:eukaryotic-like serine/threonine-protein kinase
MTPERWEQINQIYYASLEVAGSERATFLDNACAGDAEVRREVESLLVMHEQADGFLRKPAMHEVAKEFKDELHLLPGRKLGTCQILELLGAGGMGEVYLASDS